MSQHTPGPWEMDGEVDKIWATDAKGRFPVCDMRGWGHFTGKGHGALGLPLDQALSIQTANGRLIAEAPELLAALKDLLADCVEYARINNLHNSDGSPATHHSMRRAAAAVAKAEGKP